MKPYLHKAPQEEINKLIGSGKTWRYIVETYKQPDWCSRKDALAGKVGCRSITDLRGKRSQISKDYCGKCPSFKL